MSDSSGSLEKDIVDRFEENLESSEEVSGDVADALSNLTGEEDLGGRDEIAERTLEAVKNDED